MCVCMCVCVHALINVSLVKNIDQIDHLYFSGTPTSNITPGAEIPSSACDTEPVKSLLNYDDI